MKYCNLNLTFFLENATGDFNLTLKLPYTILIDSKHRKYSIVLIETWNNYMFQITSISTMSRRLIKFLRVCILFLFFHSPFYQVSKKRKKTVRYVQTAFAYDFVQFYMKQPILKFQCSKSKSK